MAGSLPLPAAAPGIAAASCSRVEYCHRIATGSTGNVSLQERKRLRGPSVRQAQRAEHPLPPMNWLPASSGVMSVHGCPRPVPAGIKGIPA